MSTEVIDRLQKLGLKSASDKLKKVAEKKRKLAIAYEHFRFVRQDKINAFNEKLKKNTEKRNSSGYQQWQTLSFTPLENYGEVPPESVLDSLESAIGKNCFDSFEVAHIVTEVKIPDPIIFGRINGCPDRFYIDAWDEDIKIEDILAANEG